MSLLVRKINKAKWFQINLDQEDDVSADAVTNCLKTTKNTLSVWQIANEDDLDKAVLALVSNQDHLETIDVVILDEASVNNYGIKIIASPGETSIQDLIDSHRDLSELTYSKIGIIKDHIVERIRNDHIKRYTRSDLKKIINAAIEKGILALDDLKESVRKKI